MAAQDSNPGESGTIRTEELLADVSRLTGMPFPNLLYRELARNPAQLASCWTRVREGLQLVGAQRLRKRIAEGAGEPGSQAHAPVVVPKPLSKESLRILRNVVDVYNTGNSCNAVLVMLMLDGAPGCEDSPLLADPVGDSTSDVFIDGAAAPELPPMLALDDMPEEARSQVLHLARVVDPRSDVIPSVFRHFADDADLMDAVHATLVFASDKGHLNRIHEDILLRIRRAAHEWPVAVEPVTDEATRLVIEPFSRVIPRMLAVCAVLRDGLYADLHD